jgi:TnpA family transposase
VRTASQITTISTSQLHPMQFRAFRLGSDLQQLRHDGQVRHRAHQAIEELGRVIRTIFICGYPAT